LKAIKSVTVNPDSLRVYSTSARLANSLAFVLSVWGSDVYDFPYKSPIHKWLVRKNLLAADIVASTSHCMAAQTRSLAPGLEEIPITPFGVDMTAYENISPVSTDNKNIVIGTVKVMADKYGIDTLIE